MPKKTENKYDKFFPKMSEKEKAKRAGEILAAYERAYSDKLDAMHQQGGGFTKYDSEKLNEARIWSKAGVEVFDVAMVGPFSVKEMVSLLGIQLPSPCDNDCFVKAMDECLGVTTFGLKETKSGLYYADFSEKMRADIKAFEDKDEKYILTRWDKFWGFFGYKTDHARAVETSLASLEVYKKRQQLFTRSFMINQLIYANHSMLENTKASYNHMKDIVDTAKSKLTGWSMLFFGNEKPNDYILDNGKKVSPVSLCMAILHHRGEYDFSEIGPKQLAEMAEKDEKLRKEIQEIGAQISEMIKNKENAVKAYKKFKGYPLELTDLKNITKTYDTKLKAMLKPENPRKVYLYKTMEYIQFGKNKDSEKKQIFGNCCTAFKMMDDMAKIFGKKDEVYGYKNAIDENVREQVKKTIEAVNLYDALAESNYDKAMELSPAGKNDFVNLEAVIKHCENNIFRIEADYNKTRVKSAFDKEYKMDEEFQI